MPNSTVFKILEQSLLENNKAPSDVNKAFIPYEKGPISKMPKGFLGLQNAAGFDMGPVAPSTADTASLLDFYRTICITITIVKE